MSSSSIKFLLPLFENSFMSSITDNDNSNHIGITTIMVCLLFGTNFFLYALFQIIKYATKSTENNRVGNEKQLSKPFTGTLDCYTNLTTELFLTSLILLLTYVCENYWYYPHSQKHYSRDLFMFILIIFFAYAYYTIKPIHDLTLLGREQTEEWKGWMQFIFLLYHYFHAEEVYNSVRIMITCYVWMTGFGNFSFFYIKRDFSWLRVFQMLWRLNFSCLLLMWTHGNTYILYYICPMHTFYFCMVYVTMFLFSSINTTKWGIRIKLFIIGILIYIIWDINGGIFDVLFAWLGTDKVIGAGNGSVWEYYFRTSLDHWSTYFGMIFALNFPLAEQYFVKAQGYPLLFASALIGGVTFWWLFAYYPLEKMSYNLYHSYMAIIPLTSYIFFRNLTPSIRSGVSMSLHDLGKTTLETYLLQHHIWLTSNAKTLLTIVSDSPWINFALASLLFLVVSKELYRVTMSLRGMIVPDDKEIAWVNSLGLGFIIAITYMCSYLLYFVVPSILVLVISSMALSLVCLLCINHYNKSLYNFPLYRHWANRVMLLLLLFVCGGILLQVIHNAIEISYSSPSQDSSSSSIVTTDAVIKTSPECLSSISNGHWINIRCDNKPTTTGTSITSTSNKVAFCETSSWIWDIPQSLNNCPIGKISTSKLRAIFQGKKILFAGDSEIRDTFYQFLNILDPGYNVTYSPALKHSDITGITMSFDRSLSIDYIWAPYVKNVSSAINKNKSKYDMIVAGAASWDALNIRSLTAYTSDLNILSEELKTLNDTKAIWLQPTTIRTERLMTDEKRKYMSEDIIKEYRSTFLSSDTAGLFSAIIDTTFASTSQDTLDGIHYGDEVYEVIAHMISNGYILQYPSLISNALTLKSTKKYIPKVTGSMSFPTYGLCILILSGIMIFCMDSFFGIGYLSLMLFGRSYDWEAAYGSFNRKILGIPNTNRDITPIRKNDNYSSNKPNDSLSVDQDLETHNLLELKSISSKS